MVLCPASNAAIFLPLSSLGRVAASTDVDFPECCIGSYTPFYVFGSDTGNTLWDGGAWGGGVRSVARAFDSRKCCSNTQRPTCTSNVGQVVAKKLQKCGCWPRATKVKKESAAFSTEFIRYYYGVVIFFFSVTWAEYQVCFHRVCEGWYIKKKKKKHWIWSRYRPALSILCLTPNQINRAIRSLVFLVNTTHGLWISHPSFFSLRRLRWVRETSRRTRWVAISLSVSLIPQSNHFSSRRLALQWQLFYVISVCIRILRDMSTAPYPPTSAVRRVSEPHPFTLYIRKKRTITIKLFMSHGILSRYFQCLWTCVLYSLYVVNVLPQQSFVTHFSFSGDFSIGLSKISRTRSPEEPAGSCNISCNSNSSCL